MLVVLFWFAEQFVETSVTGLANEQFPVRRGQLRKNILNEFAALLPARKLILVND
jgi:hypothetical protein